MALSHVSWLRDGGGLSPEDDLCFQCRVRPCPRSMMRFSFFSIRGVVLREKPRSIPPGLFLNWDMPNTTSIQELRLLKHAKHVFLKVSWLRDTCQSLFQSNTVGDKGEDNFGAIGSGTTLYASKRISGFLNGLFTECNTRDQACRDTSGKVSFGTMFYVGFGKF